MLCYALVALFGLCVGAGELLSRYRDAPFHVLRPPEIRAIAAAEATIDRIRQDLDDDLIAERSALPPPAQRESETERLDRERSVPAARPRTFDDDLS